MKKIFTLLFQQAFLPLLMHRETMVMMVKMINMPVLQMVAMIIEIMRDDRYNDRNIYEPRNHSYAYQRQIQMKE